MGWQNQQGESNPPPRYKKSFKQRQHDQLRKLDYQQRRLYTYEQGKLDKDQPGELDNDQIKDLDSNSIPDYDYPQNKSAHSPGNNTTYEPVMDSAAAEYVYEVVPEDISGAMDSVSNCSNTSVQNCLEDHGAPKSHIRMNTRSMFNR